MGLASGIGVAASVAAIVGLGVTIFQVHHDLMQKRIEQWQEVAVYSVCVGAGSKGVTLEAIKAKYQDAARDLPSELPREALQTDAINMALISLTGKDAVGLRPDGTYAATRVPPVPEGAFQQAKLDKIANFVLQSIRQQPHSLTQAQLQDLVLRAVPDSTAQDFDGVITGISLGNPRLIGFDSEGKAFLTNTSAGGNTP